PSSFRSEALPCLNSTRGQSLLEYCPRLLIEGEYLAVAWRGNEHDNRRDEFRARLTPIDAIGGSAFTTQYEIGCTTTPGPSLGTAIGLILHRVRRGLDLR